MIVIGLDPGVTTGFARWDAELRQLVAVEALKIHEAMDRIRTARPALVIFEDARTRRWFGKSDVNQAKYGAGVREGAGSIKRDCAIWEDFLTAEGIPFCAKKPASGNTKWDAEKFRKVTNWQGRTNNHARDAACLVIGLNLPMVKGLIVDGGRTNALRSR